MKYIIVFVTASLQKEAQKIADSLIKSKTAACVNIISNIESIYLWKGKKETARECLLIAKTKQTKFNELKNIVKRLHSYKVPEIIGMPVIEGNKDYLGWIEEVLR
jgi:periplasmic divalent cation tolerance protein